MSILNLNERINDFVSTFDKGTMPGVVYDSSVIGSLKDNIGIPLFPEIVRTVVSSQHEDGSFGSVYFNPFDRLLSTISSLYMMTELGIDNENGIKDKFERGINWFEVHYPKFIRLNIPHPVGFEFLFPHFSTKVMEASRGLNINLNSLELNRKKKIDQMQDKIFLATNPLFYSMEGIVDNKEQAEQLGHFQSANGSLAASPAATSLYIKYGINNSIPKAMKYINESIKSNGLICHFDDYKYMNTSFSLYPLFKASYEFGIQALRITKQLNEGWSENGISFGEAFPVPDSDDTAVALINLHNLGVPITDDRLDILLKYETDECFKTYFQEIQPSLMTNMHILEVFLSSDHERKDEIVSKLLRFVEDSLNDPLKASKYNSSPIIQIANLILSMLPQLSGICEPYVNKLQEMIQNEINEEGNLVIEEKAHALLALLYAKKHDIQVSQWLIDTLYQSVKINQYLTNFQETYTWTAKVQYSPTQISQSHILASSLLYERLH